MMKKFMGALIILSMICSMNMFYVHEEFGSSAISINSINEEKAGDNIIFDDFQNITSKSLWPTVFVINDIDNDYLPEIMIGQNSLSNPSYPYSDGLYSFTYNLSNGTFNKHRFTNNYPGPIYAIDIEPDGDIDLITRDGFYIKNETGFFFRQKIPEEYGYITPGTGDINNDGLFDFIFQYYGNLGIQTALNTGNASFEIDGWDKGLPDGGIPGGPIYHSMYENSLMDINNDGWPDICTAMGNGSHIRNDGLDALWYNWVSDGKGNWTSFSNGFPKKTYGTDIDLADLDGDGDLDYGLLTPEKLYILENDDGKRWIQHSFFHNASNITTFEFKDIDLDGDQEIVFFTSNRSTESTYNELFIGEMENDWSWSFTKQMSFTSGEPGRLQFCDIDLDGDEDIICTFNQYDIESGTFYTGNITCFFNNGNFAKNMSFTEEISSPHVRSGSIHTLSWTMKNASQYVDDDLVTNISISFNGIDGPYYPLKVNIPTFWTEVIIPDVPSENVYIKAECMGRNATIGPYVIHNSEDRTTLISAETPNEGYNLISGRTDELVISTSDHFVENDVDVKVKYDSGEYDLGEHHFTNGSITEIQWNIPDGISYMNCMIEFDFDLDGIGWTITDRDPFNIIPDELIPDRIELSRVSFPQNSLFDADVYVFTSEGIDVTDNCSFSYRSNNLSLHLNSRLNNTFSVIGSELGEFGIDILVTIYNRTFTFDETISVNYPVGSIRIYSRYSKYHVGEPYNLSLVGYDYFGSSIDISMFDVNWTVHGDGRIVEDMNTDISFIAFNSSNFSISAELISPLGTRSDLFVPVFEDLVSSLEISCPDEPVLVGRWTECQLEIVFFSMEPDYHVEWTTESFNGILDPYENLCRFQPSIRGNFTLSASVHIFNETYVISKDLAVEADIHEIVIDDIPDRMLTGEYLNLSFRILDSEGDLFDKECLIGVSTSNGSVLSAMRNGSMISLYGSSEGEVDIILNVSYLGKVIMFTDTVHVIRIPTRIEADHSSFFLKNSIAVIPFLVFDHLNKTMDNYLVDVFSSDLEMTFVMSELHVETDRTGTFNILVKVEKYGYSISHDIEITIVPNATGIVIPLSGRTVAVGESFTIEPYLVDDAGEHIEWSEWDLTLDGSISYESVENGFELVPSKKGNYSIRVSTEYYGISFSSVLELSVHELQILDNIELIRMGDDVLKVYAYDQDGTDITSKCTIVWTGSFEPIGIDTVKPSGGLIEVTVRFRNVTLSDEMEIEIGNGHDDAKDLLIVAIVASVVVLLTFIVVTLMIYRRRKEISPEE